MNLIEEIKDWQKNEGKETFKKMGVHEGDTVIDFGSGKGRYSNAIAYAVGMSGKVYALDVSNWALKELRSEMQTDNIIPVLTNNQGKLDFEDESIDFIMIYDLIHQIDSIRNTFILESCRVLKKGGILSILPFHVSNNEWKLMEKEIMANGFSQIATYPKTGIHFEMHEWLHGNHGHLRDIERGTIYNFRKE